MSIRATSVALLVPPFVWGASVFGWPAHPFIWVNIWRKHLLNNSITADNGRPQGKLHYVGTCSCVNDAAAEQKKYTTL